MHPMFSEEAYIAFYRIWSLPIFTDISRRLPKCIRPLWFEIYIRVGKILQSISLFGSTSSYFIITVLVLSKLKKVNATAPQPHRNVLIHFAIFKNVEHSLKPGETRRLTRF